MKRCLPAAIVCMVLGSLVTSQPGYADSASDAELAKQLSNPVASLISVPVKLDWDDGIGSNDAHRSVYVAQPVIPFELDDEWNLISRTIVPVYIDAESPVKGGKSLTGSGDVLQSIFFSPKAPTESGWIWGAGPVLSLPTASEDALGAEKWSIGPTAVALKQVNGWTYGALANHLWSVDGDSDRKDVSSTFLQPFLTYTNKNHTTFSLNTESTYDWKDEEWTVPVNVSVSQLTKIGNQRVQFQLGYRNYLDTPSGGPDWGLRLGVTFLFPK